MNIVRAKNAGACYGVQRALGLANSASEGEGKVSTLGPLIHNPQVVQELDARGVASVDSVSDASGDSIIVRSHGVTPSVRRELEYSGLTIIDATCPYVARAQKAAAKLGGSCSTVVVVGEEGHPEVLSLVDYAAEAGAKVCVASRPEDLPAQVDGPVGVVVQTTQTRSALQGVLDALYSRGLNVQVKDTVCSATLQRQQAARELANEVDAMVVIGGRNSSNTTRLAEICSEICPRTYHIEAPTELRAEFFDGCETVGITAGASTPESQIASVEDWLKTL